MRVEWSDVRTVFVEEVRRGSRRAWFRITTLGVPVILLVLLVAVPVVHGVTDNKGGASDKDKKVGLVDQSGILEPDSVAASDFHLLPDRESGIDALLEGEISVLYVVTSDYVSSGVVEWLYTRTSVAAHLAGEGEGRRIQALLREALVKDTLDPQAKTRFLAPASFESIVVKPDRSFEKGVEEATPLSISYIFMMLMLVSVVSGSMMLLESVSEEKQNRMIEVLVTSVSPIGVMAGKVFGLGVLGLVQVTIWAASLGYMGPRILESFPELGVLTVDPLLLVWVVAFFLAGYFVISVLMAGLGATVTSVQEGRQVAMLVLVPVYVPMFFWPLIIENPHGGVAQLLSFIPITAPGTMMLRMGAADLSVFEILASLLVTVAGGLVLLWGSARVFRAGLLMYGQRMSMGRVITALRQAG